MTVDALTSCWRSISLRIFLLSTKLYLVAYVTLFQAARPSDLTFVRSIRVVTTILSALVAFWNIVWITGLFNHSLRVHLIFHAVEIAILSFIAAFSEFWPIAVTGILLSAILFAVKFGDALSTSPHSAILREQFTLFHQTSNYDEPPRELVLQRFGSNTQLRIYASKTIIALVALDMIGLATSNDLSLFPLILLGIVLIHHLLSFFMTPILHFPSDLFLCTGEAAPLFVLPLTGSSIWGYGVGPCIIVIHWFIFITRIWNFIMKPPTSCWQRFDLMNSKENTKHAPRVSLILGRNAWTKLSLKGEHRAVKYTRAVLAIAVMGTLVIFASLLIQRAIDTRAHESAFNDFTELYDYSQVLDTPRIYLLHSTTLNRYPSIVASRANITHRCWEGVGGPELTAKCEVDPNPEYIGSVLCSAVLSGDTSPSIATESSRLPCETRVEFDFTVFDSLPLVQEIFRVVTIHVVGVNTTRAEISSLPHVTLRKHDNFVGDAGVIIRENFKSTTGLNAFGYGGSYKRINAAEFPQLRVDELYIKGSISSLRFFTVAPTFEESGKLTLKIVREYNDHSILDIFADLGGIWTFVNGMFALIFGGSLLYFLFGIKPLSRFGIVHFIFRERLRRGTRENYPRFFEEGGQPGQQDAGVIAFIREHLLGVISDDLPIQSHTSSNSPTALNPTMANTGSRQALGSELTLLSRLERSEEETMERIPLEPMRHTS